jgi:hypothetical protein
LLLLAFLLLSGALGLKTESGCDTDPNLQRASERMNCYESAALTAAYVCAPGPLCSAAVNICTDIWVRFGASIDPDTGSDQRKKAELVSNDCYFEVAKITRNSETCGYIAQRDNFGTQLFGDAVTRDACYDEAERLANLAPERYYQSGRDNICSLVGLILPLIVLGALIRK